MKSMFVALLLGLMTSSFADAFPTYTHAIVTTQVVEARACNTGYARPISCRTTAYGLLQTGQWISSWNMVYLVPGACASSYAYANLPYYFVNGYGESVCQIAY